MAFFGRLDRRGGWFREFGRGKGGRFRFDGWIFIVCQRLNPLLDRSEIGSFRRFGDAGPDRVQIDISHRGQQPLLIQEGLAFKAAFPEPALDPVFFIRFLKNRRTSPWRRAVFGFGCVQFRGESDKFFSIPFVGKPESLPVAIRQPLFSLHEKSAGIGYISVAC